MEREESRSKFNLWEYFYYRATLFFSRQDKGLLADNKNKSAFYVGVCISLNIVSLLLNSARLLSDDLLQTVYDNSFVVAITTFSLSVIFSLFYFANKKSDIIFKKYENESNSKKRSRGYVVVAYVLLTFGLIIIIPMMR